MNRSFYSPRSSVLSAVASFPHFTPETLLETRRHFFTRGRNLLGCAALASLIGEAFAQQAMASSSGTKAPGPQFPPKAKRVIYLHMVGGPSQMDLFDYKPE